MFFIIKNITGDTNTVNDFDETSTVGDLKDTVAEKIGSASCLIRLIHNGVELDDNDVLVKDTILNNEDTINIVMKLNRINAIHDALLKKHKQPVHPTLRDNNGIFNPMCSDPSGNPTSIDRFFLSSCLDDQNVLTFNEFCKEFTLLDKLKLLNISLTDQVTSIPREIGNMQNLRTLILCDCGATLEMPDEFYELKNLGILVISDSEGIVMDFQRICQNMKNLNVLDLSCSGLKGEIPKEIGDLSGLEVLMLNDNKGMFGKVPDEIIKLVKMRELNLSDSNLEAENFLEKICDSGMNKLRELILTRTCLTGTIPKNINRFNLKYLWIDDNELSGEIPITLREVSREKNSIRISGNKMLWGMITPSMTELIEDIGKYGY